MYSIDVISDSLIVWMVWIHLAILAVPLMIFTMKMEWDEVKEQKRAEAHKQPLRPHPVFFRHSRA